jgi:hypothetical protein
MKNIASVVINKEIVPVFGIVLGVAGTCNILGLKTNTGKDHYFSTGTGTGSRMEPRTYVFLRIRLSHFCDIYVIRVD